MGVEAVGNVNSGYSGSSSKVSSGSTAGATNTVASTSSSNKNMEVSAVYEKGDTSTSYKTDTATIEKLKQDADRRTQQLRSIVEKMMTKQGKTFSTASDMYAFLRSGDYEVDAATKAQAQADIAENGYWGVEQTSERLVSFAKALTGGDSSKAEEMINAVKKGFEEATKAWGDKLPDICQKTLDATIEKLNKWKDSIAE